MPGNVPGNESGNVFDNETGNVSVTVSRCDICEPGNILFSVL